MYESFDAIMSGNMQYFTFQPGVFCNSLILRRTSPQSSLQEPNENQPKSSRYKRLTILVHHPNGWMGIQLLIHEILERSYIIFTLKLHVLPAARCWADNIFWGWRATARNIGRVRCTGPGFLGGAFDSIQGICLGVWGDKGFKGIWLALRSH